MFQQELSLKIGPIPASFSVYFRLFYKMTNQIQSDKSIDGVLVTQIQSGRMEGIDESTELWRHPNKNCCLLLSHFTIFK